MTLGAYVHLPFCRVRCTYCPFAVSTDMEREESYFLALLREIDLDPAAGNLDTLYLGGGTPSRSTPALLAALVERLRTKFALQPGAEFTVEANPEDVDDEFLGLAESLGVNRVSIGVQSFNDEELTRIGRRHGATHAREALRLLRESRFRVNADLMIGLPSQSESAFRNTVEELIDSGIGHISLYMLDLEEGTKLEEAVRAGRVELPPDDVVADRYLWVIERLQAAGLAQYEISNFARPGEESRHNLAYWNRVPYRGYGVGAHRFDGVRRSANTPDIVEYIRLIEERGSATVFTETLSNEEEDRETIFLALRQRRGIGYSELENLRGEDGRRWIESGLQDGWLESSGGRVFFNARGFVLSNDYISQLF